MNKAFLLAALAGSFAYPATGAWAQSPAHQAPKSGSAPKPAAAGTTLTMSKTALLNKIKGGWAGQTIGVTYGGPMEFKYNGTIIQDYQPIAWYNGYLKKTMIESPGLYDDLYMDLTFVEVLEKEGLDAPATAFATAYANAGYALWHANQVGRYNILHGMAPPQSGQWLNNPHADCIDYQIEADFAGLMSPGMPNAASAISDRVGHVMNSGDGYYGGVYIGALYALAFTSDDIPYLVTEALKTIPAQSKYHQCISDVIGWHRQYPTDWKQTWFEVQKKWTQDVGCPDGVFKPYDIDATVNSAYVVIGLLYGNGDFGRTLDIATRCGQDADCNPSSAGGILGTLLGYDKLPAYWKQGLAEAEDIDFKYTTTSLHKVYAIGLKHALETVRRNGGTVAGEQVSIRRQVPQPVRLEQNFTGHFPVARIPIDKPLADEYSFDFEGIGYVLRGETAKYEAQSDYVLKMQVTLDGQAPEVVELPCAFTTRRYDLAWRYQLPKGKHTVRLKLLNPSPDHPCKLGEVFVYSDQPAAKLALK